MQGRILDVNEAQPQTVSRWRAIGDRRFTNSEALRRHPIRQPQNPDYLSGQNSLRLRLAGSSIPAPPQSSP